MSAGVLITREPVVNQQRAITANRLIVHAPNISAAVHSLQQLAEHWPAQHSVFVSLARLVPTPELQGWQLPDNALIEIPAQALGHVQTQELLDSLQAAGAPLALSWYQPGCAWPGATECRFALADANRIADPSGAPGIPLAWGLADLKAFETALGQGYAGAVGWFFLRGVTPAKQLAPGHAQIVRVLNLVRQGAEVKEIEAALKQDVSLSYKLLRYINSPGFGLVVEVQNFRHAVAILGMDKLNKWLSLLLVGASRDPSAPAVMQAAVARGRFMELLGAQFFERAELDNLFITGAFSLLDVLLGTHMEAVLEEMSLPEAVVDALLRNEGAYAPLLRLALATEGFAAEALREQTAQLRLAPQQVVHALLQALSFADSLQHGG